MNDLSLENLKNLYSKKRFSVPEVAKLLHCSEHKVNYWLQKYLIPKRTISEAIYVKHNPKGDPFKIKYKLNKKEIWLKGLGLGIYWGEGNKRSKVSVRLGNADPKLIKIFHEFLVKICGVNEEKIKYNLLLFNDADRHGAINFWNRELGYSHNRISSVTSLKSRGRGTYNTKSMTGVLSIEFNNTKLKKEMDKMMEALHNRQDSSVG